MGEGNGKELEVLTIKHWYSSVMDECASCMAIGAVVLLVVMSITTMIPSLSSARLLLLTSSLSKTWEVRGEVYASFFAGQVHSRSSSQPASFAGQVHCDQIKTSKATQHQAMQIVKKYLILPIVVGGSCMSILNSSLGEEIKVGLQPLPSMVLAAMPTLPSNSMGKSIQHKKVLVEGNL